jgi:hypothetical protein
MELSTLFYKGEDRCIYPNENYLLVAVKIIPKIAVVVLTG